VAGPRRADALDILDVAAVQVLDDPLRAVLAVQLLVEAEFESLCRRRRRREADDVARNLPADSSAGIRAAGSRREFPAP